jgi:hypothetical protein
MSPTIAVLNYVIFMMLAPALVVLAGTRASGWRKATWTVLALAISWLGVLLYIVIEPRRQPTQ